MVSCITCDDPWVDRHVGRIYVILLAVNGYTSYNKRDHLTVDLCNPTATLRWQPWGSFTVSDGLGAVRDSLIAESYALPHCGPKDHGPTYK